MVVLSIDVLFNELYDLCPNEKKSLKFHIFSVLLPLLDRLDGRVLTLSDSWFFSENYRKSELFMIG